LPCGSAREGKCGNPLGADSESTESVNAIKEEDEIVTQPGEHTMIGRILKARQDGVAEPKAALPPGTPAPDFTLPSKPGETISLSDFRGQPVVLAFYPADWSPVCGDQVVLYNEILPIFNEYKGAVARAYGVYRKGEGTSERALFVIDPEGIIRWSYVSPIDVNPGANGILAALEGIGAKDPKGARTRGSP
jgi:peroxiredoxin